MLATDVVLYVLPFALTWNLHVSKTQQMAVNALFALGGLVLAASGVRVYFVHAQTVRSDFTRRIAMTTMCAAIENHLAIIVACAPSIKVVLLRYSPALTRRFGEEPCAKVQINTLNVVTTDLQTEVETRERLPKTAYSGLEA